jgi:hypothetical protein
LDLFGLLGHGRPIDDADGALVSRQRIGRSLMILRCHPQAQAIQLPPPPDQGELTAAIADVKNPPLTVQEQQNFQNASFVDDNGICAVRNQIVAALHQSLVAAFIVFGWPWQDCCNSCMAEHKWKQRQVSLSFFLVFTSIVVL